ncbi:MAG TPA: TonB-dependent receptor [Puia sp.]|uniref:TonB-dependent receptor n=1 Tax=Puia sp. TaxID=2045100 RepID=UPI002C0EA941|nr:TonB-dependent receptor [Puia sp.]HVU94040.1 TonB-dependent receptor [Puia sp.]
MKLTAFLLLAACLEVSAGGFSQTITLSVHEAPLEKVFKEIERQSGYSFWYPSRHLANASKVTLQLRDASLDSVLRKCFEHQPFEYVIVERTVVIRARESVDEAPVPLATIRGKVLTAGGKALSGVSVTVKATRKGTTTDEKGEFTITVRKGDVLVFSYVGYESKEVKVADQETIEVSLAESSTALNEIAVIGYGRQTRRNLSSAISTVKSDDLNAGAITDVGQLLQGKVPGLNITASGDPNKPAAVILRGASTLNSSQTPYYVIDGVPGADISLIAPNDIVSIDILKDAAATAIYGNRAANGVIMVTTRKGKAGQAQVTYGGYAGLEKVSNQLSMMSATELRAFVTKNNMALSPTDDLGANTDWQKSIERNSAASTNHNISVSGGSEHGNYIASLNYANKEGILQGSNLQRIIGRLAVEQYALKDRLKFNFNVTNSNSSADDIAYRNVVLLQSALYLPVSPVKNADGSYFEDFNHSNYYNPVAMMNHSSLNTKYNNLGASFFTEARLPFGLKYNLNLSYQNYSSLQGEFLDSYFTSKYTNMYDNPDPGLAGHTQQTFGKNGQATRSSYQNITKTLENFVTWDGKFGSHTINAVVGYSYQDQVTNQGFTVTTANFPVNSISYDNLALSNPYGLTGYQISLGNDGLYSKTRLISDFGRVNYNYKDKYLLQGSIRRDGSSVFGANKQWGYFPSVGAAWRVSQENFMLNQNLFSEFKLRGSYGVTGNSTGFNAYTAQFLSGNNGTFYYGGSNVAAYGPIQASNPNLRWEKTATTDIGVDLGLLHNRLLVTVDVYNKNTTGMIYSYKVDPILVPAGSIYANGGSMNNKGIELGVTAEVISKRNLGWSSSLNLAHNTNKITSLTNPLFAGGDSVRLSDPEGGGQSGSTLQILKAGKPLGEFFTPQYTGKSSTGVSQYLSGDGKVTTTPVIGTDYHYAGDAQPRLILGWSNKVRYGNFDLTVFLRGTFGVKIFNATRADLFRPTTAQYTNILKEVAGESINNATAYTYSSRFIENGSYLRFDNATLGYNFKGIGEYVKSLRLYASVNNLFVITGYKGVDPEINQGGISPGIDYNNFYPKTRQFLFGLNASF